MWKVLISLAVVLPLVLADSCSCDTRAVRSALMDLYFATDGLHWRNSSGWGTHAAVCAWEGVSCGGDGAIMVALAKNNLVGTLPPSWGSLRMTAIFLEGNRLRGPLPESWGDMRALRTLSLSDNDLSGTLPASWGNMTSLDWLLLDNNTLRGALPPSWSYMNKLTLLRLRHNRLTGTLPDSYGDMTNIDVIDLGSNMLNGSLPYLWRRLSKVTVITLSDNRLEGTLPPTWSALVTLTALYVNNNSLHGAVPRDWADLRRLQSLDVSVNRLSGAVPDWFAATKWFNISHNEFSGLPVVCRLPNYLPTNFGMSHNKFAGRISVPCVPNTCADRWLARTLFDGNAFCGMCSLPPCTCAAPRAGDIGEPSISIVTAVSPSGCCAACQKHPQCVAAVYHPDIQYCELKNVTAPFEPSTKLEVLVLQ